MSYAFRDSELLSIFERKQAADTATPPVDEWEKTRWYWIFSSHNADLAVVTLVYLVAVLAAIITIVIVLPRAHLETPAGLQLIFGTAVFGTFVELIRRVYDTAVKRMATVDLFTSEMLSIVRIFASANIVGHFVRLFDQLSAPQQITTVPTGKESAERGGDPRSGFADTARQENYFSIFEGNASDLGSLGPAVVNDVTAFYTFLKASRDATLAMNLWKDVNYDVSMKQEDVISIIYHCFLMAVHAKRALDMLVKSNMNRSIVDDIVAGVLLQCFAFLDHVVPKDDFRRARIERRRVVCSKLRTDHKYLFGGVLSA